jgi:hypothetical protein
MAFVVAAAALVGNHPMMWAAIVCAGLCLCACLVNSLNGK